MSSLEQARGRFDASGLRKDLRAAWLDASVALVITLVLFLWLYHRVNTGGSPTIEVMPTMAGGADTYWMYWLCQAFGWSALLWAWLTVMLGLFRSSRPRRWRWAAPTTIEKLHRTTSLTTIGLMFAHAFWFFAEEVRGDSEGLGWAGRTWSAFLTTFVPGFYDSGTGVIAILIGLLALYLSIPLGLAFYTRRWIGAKAWRVLHAAIIVVYALSVWHTLLYGTNVWYDGWFRTTVWLLQLPVAALLLIRLFAPAHRCSRTPLDTVGRWLARGAGSATIIVTLGVAASGRDGGRTRGADGADLTVTRLVVGIGFAAFLLVVGIAVARAHRTSSPRRPSDRTTDAASSRNGAHDPEPADQ